MSEKLKLEFDTKLKLHQVQIQRLIDETIDLKMQIKCLRRENEDLLSGKKRLQDKYSGLRNDYDALESYCARISQDIPPYHTIQHKKARIKLEPLTGDAPLDSAKIEASIHPITAPSTGNDRQDCLHSVSPSEISIKDEPTPAPNNVRPFRYEPPNRAEYETYIDRNHICMADLCRHYHITEVSRNTGVSTPVDCLYAKHPKHRFLHVEYSLQAGSHAYSKMAALCQASEKYSEYWDPQVAEKLYAAIIADVDGFFA